jgi:hypothetical protein
MLIAYDDMIRANYTFTLPNGTIAHTCPPAMGEFDN